MKYSIYLRSSFSKSYIWVKTIYQKWDEDDIPYKRRVKRTFKKWAEKHPDSKYILVEEND